MINPLDQFMELSYHIFIMATQSTDAAVTRPIQYGTTFAFLQHFGLRSLDDLPPLKPEEAPTQPEAQLSAPPP
jgi:chromosome segregation and condensation protein ScpB